MITPILERLLLTGRAYKWNKVHGVSAAGRIKCPANRFLVITDIWYTPFQDQTLLVPNNQHMQLNLRGANSQDQQNYVIKNQCWLDPDNGDAIVDGNVVHFDVFDVFKSDVIITILKSSQWDAGGVDFAPLDPQAQQQLSPIGYGISEAVARNSTDGAGLQNIPAGLDTIQGVTPGSNASENYRFLMAAGTSTLERPVNTLQIPLVNFTVIVVNSDDLANLQ